MYYVASVSRNLTAPKEPHAATLRALDDLRPVRLAQDIDSAP